MVTTHERLPPSCTSCALEPGAGARTCADATSVPSPVTTVVLGVARRGQIVSSEQLFTFTQVTLVRQVAALQSRGVDVLVAPILRPE